MKPPYKLIRIYAPKTGRWNVEYYFLNPDTDKYVRFKIYVSTDPKSIAAKRKEAERIKQEITDKLIEGYDPFAGDQGKNKTISEAIEYVNEIKRLSCRKRTYWTYSNMMKRLSEWLEEKKLTNMNVNRFSTAHAWQFMDWMQTTRKLSNRTYNYRRMHFKTMFTVLVTREWIKENPFRTIEKLTADQTSINFFTIDELRNMNKNLPVWDYNLYCVACLIFYCYLRPQEIVRMKIKYIDLDNSQIIIPGEMSKNKKSEAIVIPPAMDKVLRNMDLTGDKERHLFSTNLIRGYREIAPTRIAGRWRDFADFYGIEKNIYALKHTGVGMAVDAGINLRDLQLQLRHYSLEQTQQYLDRFRKKPSEQMRKLYPDLSDLKDAQMPLGKHQYPQELYNIGNS